MPVVKRRSVLVTFRVSAEEREHLANGALECGARSIADFAREAALQKIQTLHAPAANLSGDLTTLSKGLGELDHILGEMRERIRAVLGPVPSTLEAGRRKAGFRSGEE